MKGLRVLAIFVGMVVANAGFILSGIIIAVVIITFYASQGMQMKDIMVQVDTEHIGHSMLVLLMSIGFGGFFSCVGGFVTGWLAKSFQLKNALGMGVLLTLFGVLFWGLCPLWYNLICLVFTPIAVAVGGYFAQTVFAGRIPATK